MPPGERYRDNACPSVLGNLAAMRRTGVPAAGRGDRARGVFRDQTVTTDRMTVTKLIP